MRWSVPSDRRLVEAVVASFHEPAERAQQQLAELRHRDWLQTCHWLDASGMALYFLERVQTLGIESVLPSATLERLRLNLIDNRARTASLFTEFTSVNQAFLQSGIRFCNLKGFTLSPDCCPNPALRSQLDLDLLVDGSDLDRCCELLEQFGYILAARTRTVWELRAGSSELARMEDHYKPRQQRSLELHFAPSATNPATPSRDERLDRVMLRSWNDLPMPVLSGGDQFVSQALHLFKHLRSAYTRLSWLLEYRRNLTSRYDDQTFWAEVRERAQNQHQAAIAIGVASLISTRVFGGSAPPILNQWTVDRLSPSIVLWIEMYGRRSVLADFPGTKLYLLLEGELSREDPRWRQRRRSSLLPLRSGPGIQDAARNDGLTTRVRREFYQLRYLIFRLRFHCIEGLRYAIEARRWKRALAALSPESEANPAGEQRLVKGQNA